MKNVIGWKITVVAVIEETRLAGKEWKEIGHNGDKPEYGYTPEITKTVREERQVFEQRVDALNLGALVGVVNALEENPKSPVALEFGEITRLPDSLQPRGPTRRRRRKMKRAKRARR